MRSIIYTWAFVLYEAYNVWFLSINRDFIAFITSISYLTRIATNLILFIVPKYYYLITIIKVPLTEWECNLYHFTKLYYYSKEKVIQAFITLVVLYNFSVEIPNSVLFPLIYCPSFCCYCHFTKPFCHYKMC